MYGQSTCSMSCKRVALVSVRRLILIITRLLVVHSFVMERITTRQRWRQNSDLPMLISSYLRCVVSCLCSWKDFAVGKLSWSFIEAWLNLHLPSPIFDHTNYLPHFFLPTIFIFFFATHRIILIFTKGKWKMMKMMMTMMMMMMTLISRLIFWFLDFLSYFFHSSISSLFHSYSC